MNPTWKYLLDQMEIETANNTKKAVALSQYHDSALKTLSVTYPGLLPLYERYHPLHLTLIDEYSNLDSTCLLYTSPSPRDRTRSRMPSSA